MALARYRAKDPVIVGDKPQQGRCEDNIYAGTGDGVMVSIHPMCRWQDVEYDGVKGVLTNLSRRGI